VSQATQPNTTPTRRSALAFSAAAIVAGFTVPALAGVAAEDPILALYCRYRELEDASLRIEELTDLVRAGLTERCGEPRRDRPANQCWGQDPAYTELLRLNDECDQAAEGLTDVTDKIMETPATTLAGLQRKMRVGLDLWPTSGGDDYHELAALAFMKDALRLLSGSAAV
jgi:hypothetical protein